MFFVNINYDKRWMQISHAKIISNDSTVLLPAAGLISSLKPNLISHDHLSGVHGRKRTKGKESEETEIYLC